MLQVREIEIATHKCSGGTT